MTDKRILTLGACTAIAVTASRFVSIKRVLSSLRPKNVQFLTIDDKEFVETNQEYDANDFKYHVLMPFIPGAFTSSDSYLPFLREIQIRCAKLGIRLDIAFGSFFFEVPNEAENDHILEAILKSAKEKGIKYDAKFLTGHSMGGYLAIEKAVTMTYDALIQIGCSMGSIWGVKDHRSLASYPQPVLTLVGEMDGFLRGLKLMHDMDTLDEEISREGIADDALLQKKRNKMDIVKPIIIHKEVNHLQAADNTVTEFQLKSGRHDFESALTPEEARERMAETISNFVLIVVSRTQTGLSDKSAYVSATEKQLKQSQDTREMLRPFRELSSTSSTSQFVMEAQRSIANLVQDIDITPTFHNSDEDFLYAKPFHSLAVAEKDTTLTTNIEVVAQDPILLDPKLPEATRQESPSFAIKAKSQDTFLQLSSSITKKEDPVSLRELNMLTMAKVLKEYVTQEQRVKYELHGRKLEFLEDLEIKVPPEWVKTPIQLTHEGNTTFVRSPFTRTSTAEFMPLKFRGMHYIKPMSPAQIYEWIVYDAFRHIPSK
ncbi:unnamed protein product [Cylindrotheca closterium]|uniref:Uncharacterized protein n=1 Tax=Cylindrotheca closterium TaxID=2856 RepID=A0AAD2CLS7_9STRA|nr:unnamed protein product [Cylindrotheca closterium]